MNALIDWVAGAWDVVAGSLIVLLAIVASSHVVLHKRDTRSAVGWAGLIWLAPVIGALLYLIFGVNRIRRRAAERRAFRGPLLASGERPVPRRGEPPVAMDLGHLGALAGLVGRVTRRPLTEGNAVTALVNGDEAFPVMLAAIDGATTSVGLSTYIFDNDAAGRLFHEALERAVKRGVEVRVLIDAVGSRYSWPPSHHALARRGVPVARFGITLLPWRLAYMNLRNHRKLLVVDGKVGFTGGMNIREGCLLHRAPRHAIQDLHFRLEGPIVAHLTDVFMDDWAFATREMLTGPRWFSPASSSGPVVARGIASGPDEDLENTEYTLLGAVACARESVTVMTPYFLPDHALMTAMGVAALRGVRVRIILPEVNNQLLVHWAARAQLWQVLQRGCEVHYTPGPFDHSKVMLVDGAWAMIGSSNWDARSLRLNWEFDVECYDRDLATQLERIVEGKLARARPVTLTDVEGRRLPARLRDGVAKLFTPYL